MKKFLVTWVIFVLGIITPTVASENEIVEDYMDMAAHNCLIGDYEDAVAYLDKIIALVPNGKEIPRLKELLYQLGTKNQKSFISGYNEDLDRAFSYVRVGDKVSATNILKDATKSNNFWVYSYLGDFYRENKDYKQAVEAYFMAYQIEPSFTQALLSIAICYLEYGDYEAVNEPLKRFLYFNQQCDLAYAIRAKAYLKLNRLVDAETEIVTALALNNDIEYQLIYGEILYRKGNYAKAINILNKVAENAQISEVFKYLGLSYLAVKEYNNAMLNLDKAILLSNDDKELNQKYNEAREFLKNTNLQKLEEEEHAEAIRQQELKDEQQKLQSEQKSGKKQKKKHKKEE